MGCYKRAVRTPITGRLKSRTNMSGEQLWLLAGLFTIAHGTNVSTPLLVLYQDRLGLGDGKTMAIFVAYVGGILITLLLAGPLSDRIGRRAVCVPAMVLSATASIILVFGRDEFVLLLVGRALLGAASGAFIGVVAAWIQELMGRGTELRAAAVTTLTTYVGFGSGPMSTVLFEQWLPYPLVLPLVFHVALVAVALPGVFGVTETRAESSRRARLGIEFGLPAGQRREFLLVIGPAAFWVFAFPSNSFALFPVLLRDATEGFEVLVAGLSGALTAWAGLLSRPMIARHGVRSAMPLAMAVGAIGLLLGAVSFATDWWPLLLPAAALLGAASATLMIAGLAFTSEIADDDSRGALTTTFYVFAYCGMATPILVTSLGSVWSTSVALVILTAVAAVAGTVVARTVRMVQGPGGS